MYEIIKILNNNTILVEHDREEMIVMAKGIGFGKKVKQMIEIPTNAKKYMMQKNYQPKEPGNIIDYIDLFT